MRHLVYVLRFQGEALPVGIDGNVLKTTISAPGCTVTSRIGSLGLSGSLQPELGDEARVESELTITGPTTFQETGTIVFGVAGHSLRFSTVGAGHLEPAAEAGRRHGAAIWRIDSGEGQFAGASGLILSRFLLSEAGAITDYHLGVIVLR